MGSVKEGAAQYDSERRKSPDQTADSPNPDQNKTPSEASSTSAGRDLYDATHRAR
jgi:hypothetical protein